MTKNQIKQARRDQQEKQHALYGYCLTPRPGQGKKNYPLGSRASGRLPGRVYMDGRPHYP